MISTRLTDGQGFYPLESVRVIDGDAIEARIILPFGSSVQKRIRLKDWWADELNGPWANYGYQAKEALEEFCFEKVLWLACPSERTDRYGRIIGSLVHEEKFVLPAEVLGALQLTAAEHKRRLDIARKCPPAAPRRPGNNRDGFFSCL